jgi:SprT protein
MPRPTVAEIISKHIPEAAVSYCLELWHKYPFELVLKKSRVTKVGDFCFRPGRKPKITLNSDLYPFLFLVTYIHEFSHHAVHIVYGNRTDPHGKEWKQAFSTFMEPVLRMGIFPDDLLACLQDHLKEPMASSFSDGQLTALFRKYDPSSQHLPVIKNLAEGEVFALRGKKFIKGTLRRTRFICTEVKTGRIYLVPADLTPDY